MNSMKKNIKQKKRRRKRTITLIQGMGRMKVLVKI